MSKKLIITLSVFGGIVAIFLVLCWTLFGFSAAKVQFHSTTLNLKLSEQEIVEAANFNYGSSVLFEGKKKYLKNLEEKAFENKNFAYLRALNIETVFPNKMVIHVAEREQLFAVAHNNQFLICDRDLRVLEIWNSFDNTAANAVVVNDLTILDEEIKIGQFLNVKENAIKKFYSVMAKNNRDLSQIYSKFKEINISTYRDNLANAEYVSFELLSHQNRKFVINNPDFAFANKVQKLFAAESSLFSQKTDENGNILTANNEILYVVKTQNNVLISFETAKTLKDEQGEPLYNEADKFALTYAHLSNCFIKVDNLTITKHTPRTENDIFYALVEM